MAAFVEAQPTAEKQAEREWMAGATERMDAAVREERAAEEAKRVERESSGSVKPSTTTAPASKQATAPTAPAPTRSIEQEIAESRARRGAPRRDVQRDTQEYEARLAAVAQQLAPSAQNWHAVQSAWRRRDFDGLAKALGVESFDTITDERIKALTDPSHSALAELRSRVEEREEQDRWAAQQRAQAEARQREAMQAEHDASRINEAMSLSEHPALQAAHGLPPNDPWRAWMVGNLRQVLRAANRPMTIEQAMAAKVFNGESLEQITSNIADRAARLGRLPEKPPVMPAAKPSPAPKPERREDVPHYRTPERLKEDAWLAKAKQQWDAAVAADRKRGVR